MTPAPRSKIRFKPDLNTLAWVSPNESFSPQYVGLVENESYDGFCFIINYSLKVNKGDQLYVTVGKLAPLPAEVRWVREVAKGIFKLGIQFTA